jgi:D-serine deaminase-like pyridoxal phosphate-dependent protein
MREGRNLLLETPALLLDEQRMDRNIERMRSRLAGLRVAFRPHVKTNKSIDVSRRLMETPQGPITVSTLLEAGPRRQAAGPGRAAVPDPSRTAAARSTARCTCRWERRFASCPITPAPRRPVSAVQGDRPWR